MGTLRPTGRERLFETVLTQLIDLIEAGDLQSGELLPPERALAAQLGVSRAVLQEAFRVLEERGLVVSRRGSGRRVRAPEAGELRRPHLFDLERASIIDVLESRELVEVGIVRLACERITSSEEPFLRAAARADGGWSDNVEFHTCLASVARNFMLERIVAEQLDILDAVHQRDHYPSTESAPELIAEHVGIAEAVVARDVERAQHLMREHFQHTRELVAKGGTA